VNDPDIDFKAVASNIEKEQVLAIKVLRNVNSAHFCLRKRVSSIQDASSASADQIAQLLAAVEARCPVSNNITNATLVTISMTAV
jgi:HD-like signal output (HDOD) protein